jgi:hypothetical protein
VPSRIVLVSRAMPASVIHASLGLLRDGHQVVVRRALLGFGEDAQLHATQPVRRRKGM